MSLLEEAEDLKKQLEALETEEGEPLPEEVEEAVDEEESAEEEEAPEEVVEEKPAEEAATAGEVKGPEVEEKPDAAAFARMRRELAALKKAQAAPPAQAEPVEATDESPLNAELADVIIERRKVRAAQEFERLEQDFSRLTPGYEDTEDTVGIATQYKATIYNAIHAQNPRMSHVELLEQTRETLLKKAGTYLNQGFDPIEEMYQDAIALGLKAQPRKAATTEEKPVLKPDLSKVAANQKRNAGTAAARGSSGDPEPTLDFVATGDVKEWLRLKPDQKKKYLEQLKSLA